MKTKLLLLLALALASFATGCANVKPWQRGTLADEAMRPERNAASTALNEHVWFSREAATGGCGCN